MFSVPSINTLTNSIEASLASGSSIRIRNSSNLRRSDREGLVRYLRSEYGIRGATVSVGRKSITVYFSGAIDRSVAEATREAVYKFAQDHDYVVCEPSKKYSFSRITQRLMR